MGINHWEWEGMGILIVFLHTSTTENVCSRSYSPSEQDDKTVIFAGLGLILGVKSSIGKSSCTSTL